MNKTEIQEWLASIEEGLRELASECEGAAEMLATIGENAIEDDTLSKEATQRINDTIINLDYVAGFPGDNPLRGKVDALEEIRDEAGAEL